MKLDVQACFDTIEQTRLLEILRDIISHVRPSIHYRCAWLTACAAGRVHDPAVRPGRRDDGPGAAAVREEGHSRRCVAFSAIHTSCVNGYVRDADDHPHFLLHASKLAESLRHAIFVDQVMYC